MTFDSCQGEERDVIFYSMVANNQQDKLDYIFPKDFGKGDDDEANKKLKRLNVGFSRAKETIHFVLSKNINDFTGTISEVLSKYNKILDDKKHEDYTITDKNSPMEDKIKSFIENTSFFKEKLNDIELKCQFPIGEYLKQIDKTYNHPKYKVDFLIIYKNKHLIIEYDGFEYHFEDDADEHNYENKQKDADVYRQRTLEKYGYPFLRLNKFNLTNDPITKINLELRKILD